MRENRYGSMTTIALHKNTGFQSLQFAFLMKQLVSATIRSHSLPFFEKSIDSQA
jgi:hypothetical protein